jgi:hypothetical protein
MDLVMVATLLTGVGIAAAGGLRAFLPLFVIGIAARAGIAELDPRVAWLSSDRALLALGIATVVEIAGDKIPIVDHALDAIGLALRPLAAALGAYSVLVHWPTPWAQILALLLGGGALALHVAHAKLRLGSTAATAGHANPLLSVIEDGTALMLLAVAILAPLLILAAVAAFAWLLTRRRRRAATA